MGGGRNAMMIGYARVSTDEQNLALQLDALRSAGCEEIFQDTGLGADVSQPGRHPRLNFRGLLRLH
jgi:DNA invertase Pin-like site-specific DNA recombinase